MSEAKKKIRKNFRDVCFARDHYCCVMCGFRSTKDKAEKELDCHHIVNPKKIVHGGFVKENGITLCPECHLKAEIYHSTGTAYPGYSPEDLFRKISSSEEKAIKASIVLGGTDV